MVMRAFFLALQLAILPLSPSTGNAGDRLAQSTVQDDEKLTIHTVENYRGFHIDLSEIARRQNFEAVARSLRHQLDIVESVGLSPRLLEFFHTVPIVAGEAACLARSPDWPPDKTAIGCYGPERTWRPQREPRVFTIWNNEKYHWANPDVEDLMEDTKTGSLKVRPVVLDAQSPILLQGLLFAYFQQVLPQGTQNQDILLHYNLAKSDHLYTDDALLLINQKLFFATTASVFLYGQSNQEPRTRTSLKQKQPDYYKYLVRLFEFDPDGLSIASTTASTSAHSVLVGKMGGR
jgi:hypothetical protein